METNMELMFFFLQVKRAAPAPTPTKFKGEGKKDDNEY